MKQAYVKNIRNAIRIKYELAQRGITQTQIAEELNISKTAVYRAINGLSVISKVDEWINEKLENKSEVKFVKRKEKQKNTSKTRLKNIPTVDTQAQNSHLSSAIETFKSALYGNKDEYIKLLGILQGVSLAHSFDIQDEWLDKNIDQAV